MVDKVYKDKCEAWVDGDVDGVLVSVFIKKTFQKNKCILMKLLPVKSWAEGGEELSGNTIYASWSLAAVNALPTHRV